jgi:hypothetical protein
LFSRTTVDQDTSIGNSSTSTTNTVAAGCKIENKMISHIPKQGKFFLFSKPHPARAEQISPCSLKRFCYSTTPMTPTQISNDCIQTINDLINGNLTDAKKRAKKHSSWKLMNIAELMGYTNPTHYVAMVGYLKDLIDFQKYCELTKDMK